MAHMKFLQIRLEELREEIHDAARDHLWDSDPDRVFGFDAIGNLQQWLDILGPYHPLVIDYNDLTSILINGDFT